jgi:hypothetical protein
MFHARMPRELALCTYARICTLPQVATVLKGNATDAQKIFDRLLVSDTRITSTGLSIKRMEQLNCNMFNHQYSFRDPREPQLEEGELGTLWVAPEPCINATRRSVGRCECRGSGHNFLCRSDGFA